MTPGGNDVTTPLILNELTRDGVLEVAPHATLVLPTAATEQHGPHLPLATDCIIAEAMATGASAIAAREVPVVVAPVVPFGNSNHHLIYAALSMRTSTYVSLLTDLVDCAVKSGFRRIFLLNAHGGNDEAIRMVARDLVLRSDVAVGACSYWAIGKDAAIEAGADPAWQLPGHSGGFETSLMMALRADLVRSELRPKDADHPRSISSAGIADGLLVLRSGEWKRIDGYTDAPITASASIGRQILEALYGEVGKAIVAFHRAV